MSEHLVAHEFIPAVGHALACSISASHTPAPLRYVWHHIPPQACGGKSTSTNLLSVCDNCHYAIHALMYQLKRSGKVTPNRKNNPLRVKYATAGYELAVAAGTVASIPNEGAAAQE